MPVYCGVEKPALLYRYLSDYVAEMNDLSENGVEIDGMQYNVEIMAFVCDRPARSFLRGTIGHTGYYACERCEQKSLRSDSRMVYPEVNDQKCTDQSFRSRSDEHHHLKTSPLELIKPPIDMVRHFALDFMHMVCLGVMKKLLTECWLDNITGTRMDRMNVLRLTQRITNLHHQILIEFQRTTTQSLALINKWKATEFRFFVLYVGPYLLKDLLPLKLYNHFLLLHVASRIHCCLKLMSKYFSVAKKMLKIFVLQCCSYYKLQTLIMNVHNLIHIADECPLDSVTAFPFESMLGRIKNWLRSGNKPLAQDCRRIEEHEQLLYQKKPQIPKKLCIESSFITESGELYIKSLQYRECKLSCKLPNNCIMTKSQQFYFIQKICQKVYNEFELLCKKINISHPAFDSPIISSNLNIFLVNEINSNQETINLSDVNAKCLYLEVYELEEDDKLKYVMPLLHC